MVVVVVGVVEVCVCAGQIPPPPHVVLLRGKAQQFLDTHEISFGKFLKKALKSLTEQMKQGMINENAVCSCKKSERLNASGDIRRRLHSA